MQRVGLREQIGGGRKAEEKRDQMRSGVGGVFPHQNILSGYGNDSGATPSSLKGAGPRVVREKQSLWACRS